MVFHLYRLVFVFFLALFLTACASDTPELVDMYEVGDSQMSCQAIRYEISALKKQGREIAGEKSSTKKKNIALGVGGLFVWPAWFFMNLSSGKVEELKSIERRINALKRLGITKCDSYNIHEYPSTPTPQPVQTPR